MRQSHATRGEIKRQDVRRVFAVLELGDGSGSSFVMAKPTDARVVGCELFYLPVRTRMPQAILQAE